MSVSHASRAGTSHTEIAGDLCEVDLSDIATLYALFARVRDPRQPRGIRHHIGTVLTVLVLSVLAGAGSFRQAGDRARDLPTPLLAAAGARRHRRTGALLPPSGDTLRRVVEDIDADAADLLVCRWIADRARSAGAGNAATADADTRPGIAIDGKTVRNSGGGDPAANVKLFSAMLHQQAVVIGQIRIPEGTTEVTQVAALLDPVDLTGAVVTGDAAHCLADTAAYVRSRDADYVLTVKGNQPTLLERITAALAQAAAPGHHLDIEHNRGRIVHRQIWTTDAERVDFPDATTVFRIRRDTFDLSGQRLSKDIVHGITSLATTTPEAISQRVRLHWGQENKLHWVRDVVYHEDHQHAYLGNAAHSMAVFRNLAIALIRLAGHTQIKRTLEWIAADRMRIPPLLAASRPRPTKTLL